MSGKNDTFGAVLVCDGKILEEAENTADYENRIFGHAEFNDLVEHGLAFTYATARSIESARTITGELRLKLPAITRNGAVLADNTTGKHIEKAVFFESEVNLLKELLPELPRYGFVSCFIGEEMHRLYAVGNALDELKQLATGIIGDNDDDAVAEFLRRRMEEM